MSIKIYHNPRCSKSRQTLELLHDRGIEPTVIAYLDTPPAADELRTVLHKLGITVDEIMRTGEAAYKADRTEVAAMSDTEKLRWLSEPPTVIQRPIVISGDAARIGRPPESVLDILS